MQLWQVLSCQTGQGAGLAALGRFAHSVSCSTHVMLLSTTDCVLVSFCRQMKKG
jgi:hypothetical protein